MGRPSLSFAFVFIVGLGCGSRAEPAATPASTEADGTESAAPAASTSEVVSEPAAAPEPERKLPEACAEGAMCSMPADFAKRLCAGTHSEVALHLFAPKTPWKRAYLKRAFKAWHVGGRGDLRELRTGEEVIVVSIPKSAGTGMQIGGQAFEVLRWDGTCVSLMEDEIGFAKPSNAVPANIDFEELDPNFRNAFSEDKSIELSAANKKRTCEGPKAEQEPGKSKCELARRHLSLTIAQAVGKGKALPPLAYFP